MSRVFNATWQRRRDILPAMPLPMPDEAGTVSCPRLSPPLTPKETAEAASIQWRKVADQLRPAVPKPAKLMDDAEQDVLAYTSFPPQHRTKLHSTNPLERLNGEIKRRTEVVGIFPNEDAITRLVGAILSEQNDEWAVQRSRCMTLESVAQIGDDPLVTLPPMAA